MKKKILIIVGSVVVVLGIGVAILAANLNKIVNSKKGVILAQAKAQTGRDISIGDVGVTIWRGLGARVDDVVISDDPAYSSEPFVRAKQLVVNVKLLPLLKKQVEIKRFVLVEPNIVIMKVDSTRFNFTSMIEAAAPPPTAGVPGSKPKPKSSSMAAALAFADIKDGTLRYADRVAGTDRTIRDIDFTASNVGIGQELDAKLDAAVFGEEQDVHVEASTGKLANPADKAALAATPIEINVELKPVAVATLMEATKKPNQPAAQPVPGTVEGHAKLGGTIGAANLDELELLASMLGAEKPNVKITASGGPFDFTADSTLVFAHAKLKGKLETEPIALADFKMKSKDPKVPPPVLGGDMKANATFEGNLTALAFQGNIDATNASFEQKPQGMVKKPGIPAKATVRGTFRPEKTPGEGIDFEKIDIVFHSLTATGSGRMVPFTGKKALELTLDAKTPLKPWNELMPAMAPFGLSGDATANVHVSGMPTPTAPAQITGTAHLKNVGATVKPMPKPVSDGQATVAFTAKTANIKDGSFRIGDSRFRVDANVTSFKPMRATYNVKSDEVKRLDVQAPAAGAKAPARPEVFKQVTAQGNMVETAPKVNQNTIVVTSKSGIVANLEYADFAADVKATPTTTTIERYSAKAMGGTLSGSGTMEPKISKFNVSTKIENVNLAEYFKYKAPALSDVLVGRLSGDINIAGQGKEWEAIAKTLSGDGNALVLEGALLNVNIAEEIFSSIKGIPMVPANLTEKMRARNPKLFAQDKTLFENLSSKFQISNGRINTSGLKLGTGDFSLAGDGWISLGKEMNLNSTLTLSKKLASDLVAEVPAAKMLLNSEGRIDVPLNLTGALMKPAVRVDTQAMTAMVQKGMLTQGQKQVEDKVKGGVKGLLDNLGKKKEPAKPPAPTPPDTTKPAPPDTTRG